MRGEGITGHELVRHLPCQFRRQSPLHVDPGQLRLLRLGLRGSELAALAREVGLLGIGLGADGDVLAGRHGEGTRREAGDRRQQYGGAGRLGRRDADDEAAGGDEAIVGAEHGGAQPADVFAAVTFTMHDCLLSPSPPPAAHAGDRE